jgi:hypothetical protein
MTKVIKFGSYYLFTFIGLFCRSEILSGKSKDEKETTDDIQG